VGGRVVRFAQREEQRIAVFFEPELGRHDADATSVRATPGPSVTRS
jgi:hypothetical protein